MLKNLLRKALSWSVRNRFRRIEEIIHHYRIRWNSGKPMSPAVEGQLLEHRYLRPKLLEMADESTWCVDSFSVTDDAVEIRGWALVPFDRYSPATFLLNGRPFDEIDFPRERADVGGVFWYRVGASNCGFVCRTFRDPNRSIDEIFPNGFAEIRFCDARTGASFCADHDFYAAHPAKDDFPDAGDARRVRVHGNSALESFRIQGSSAFMKLERALNKTSGKSLQDCRRILDWGCGCGRLTRYFRDLPGEIHGIDIDRDNIEWSRAHFDFGHFEVCEVDPPTKFPDDHFDLAFGISVMTHLSERDRFAWLAELARITTDDGVVLLTTQGHAALCRSRIGSETMIKLREQGSIDVDVSVAAEDLSPEPRRYIDCFLLEEYIRHRWAEHFDVLDVIPGYIGNVQDLVVLRKKRVDSGPRPGA